MSDSSRLMRSSFSATDNKYKTKFEPLRQQRKRNKVTKFTFNADFRPDRKSEFVEAKVVGVDSGQDICDCLNVHCPGCFFRCPNKRCKSYKCGPDCRMKRRFTYQSIEDPIASEKRVLDLDDDQSVIHIA